ncbi:hypothetical protein E1N52_12595 [Paraburkholderia guartelaensis]|jgi:hypothetical protein|uniref:Uncharacterized protein n=1 Tax=Paraburkholderia guartelaensis TaxID=2546446 RepID=A0A4R5LFR8_9BURK|nr:hypothetical protein [Paraburkholderia guartelaensis]TDG08209.1 hypothetical protein E1N52_12595 [Paraburkholderia guartelaensis]
MFNSTVLEVGIGLVFCYFAVSLAVSTVTELFASLLQLRAKCLLSGVKQILNDPQFNGMARDLYNHALVSPRDSGDAKNASDLKYKPSYIPSKDFALAMIDILRRAPGANQDIGQSIATIQNQQLREVLQAMYRHANEDVGQFSDALGKWFDNGMDRLSGTYKRWSQFISFAVALVIVIALNVDTVFLFRILWLHPSLAGALHGNASSDAVSLMNQLPIGWQRADAYADGVAWMIVGWLLTASATLFGAPFWFDLLQNVTNLRGTGPSTDDAARKAASN